mgnify:CR=1 FL=1
MQIDDILLEWSYRLKKGYPTMENGQFTDPVELQTLQEILQENGINEMPSFVKSKTPVSDVIREAISAIDVKKAFDERLKAILAMGDEMEDKETDPDKAEQLQLKLDRLHKRILAFSLYDPLKAVLKKARFKKDAKGGFDMPKKIANELQRMLEDLPPDTYETLVEYLTRNEQLKFPTENNEDNFKTLLAKSGVADEMIIAIAEYSGQDEGVKGVGMAEIMMAILFENIQKPDGAGDLELDGQELEVKGWSARLGASGGKSLVGDPDTIKDLKSIGITLNKGKEIKEGELSEATTVHFDGDGISKSGTTAVMLALAAKDHGGDKVAAVVKRMMPRTNLIVPSISDVNWEDPIEINRFWGLGNLIKYHKGLKNKFGAFIACDLGTTGPSKGDYIFAKGSIDDIVAYLWTMKCGFEGFNLNSNLLPRIEYKAAEQKPSDLEEK